MKTAIALRKKRIDFSSNIFFPFNNLIILGNDLSMPNQFFNQFFFYQLIIKKRHLFVLNEFVGLVFIICFLLNKNKTGINGMDIMYMH